MAPRRTTWFGGCQTVRYFRIKLSAGLMSAAVIGACNAVSPSPAPAVTGAVAAGPGPHRVPTEAEYVGPYATKFAKDEPQCEGFARENIAALRSSPNADSATPETLDPEYWVFKCMSERGYGYQFPPGYVYLLKDCDDRECRTWCELHPAHSFERTLVGCDVPMGR
jgi:hypothetical protein